MEDCSKVFLDPEVFGEPKTIRYWDKGSTQEPLVLKANVVVDTDENMAAVWNREKAYQTDKNEPVLGQMTYTMYIALSEIGFTPKRHRQLAVDNKLYQVRDVSTEDGMLIVALRRMEE